MFGRPAAGGAARRFPPEARLPDVQAAASSKKAPVVAASRARIKVHCLGAPWRLYAVAAKRDGEPTVRLLLEGAN
ncbi:MAG: hypothetical protein JWP02_2437 [Acidimicrobiales bacterium]|nr:hypothetical protein [Acidimicrobiales bacterium]